MTTDPKDLIEEAREFLETYGHPDRKHGLEDRLRSLLDLAERQAGEIANLEEYVKMLRGHEDPADWGTDMYYRTKEAIDRAQAAEAELEQLRVDLSDIQQATGDCSTGDQKQVILNAIAVLRELETERASRLQKAEVEVERLKYLLMLGGICSKIHRSELGCPFCAQEKAEAELDRLLKALHGIAHDSVMSRQVREGKPTTGHYNIGHSDACDHFRSIARAALGEEPQP